MKQEIRHIGYHISLCGRIDATGTNIVRQDLGAKRYKQLGVRERFKNEAPYRVCKRCIAAIVKRERGSDEPAH
jgi:hypothetical protein